MAEMTYLQLSGKGFIDGVVDDVFDNAVMRMSNQGQDKW